MGPRSSLHHRGGPPWPHPAGPAVFCFGVQGMPALGAEAMERRVCRRGTRADSCSGEGGSASAETAGASSTVWGERCWAGGDTHGGVWGCDRRPGHCAGTRLRPSPGAAAQGGKRVSPAGGTTPKLPKIPLPVAGGRRAAPSSSPGPEGLTAVVTQASVATGRNCVSGTGWLRARGQAQPPHRGHRPATAGPAAAPCHKAAYIRAGRWQRAGSWARSVYSGRRANTTAGTF